MCKSPQKEPLACKRSHLGGVARALRSEIRGKRSKSTGLKGKGLPEDFWQERT